MSAPFGPRRLLLSAFGGRLVLVADRRVVAVTLALAVVSLMLVLVSLASGQVRFSLGEVLAALTGGGSRRARLVVLEWRLPRALAAVVLGALLGLGGALFQSVTRNPLGSPDVVGFDAGAFTGALLAIVFGLTSWVALAGSAVAGGLGTAAIIYGLAWRGGIQGFPLIVIGIALSAMLSAVNQWILLSLPIGTAMAAGAWASGTLARVSAEQVSFALISVVPVLLAAAALSNRMRLLEMGDERARSLGVAVEPVRLCLTILAVVSTALATAVAGPIPFVALAAPQIARVLTRSAGTNLPGAMAVGSVLLLAADFTALRVIAPDQIPVGVVTLAIGGAYFLWLILKGMRP